MARFRKVVVVGIALLPLVAGGFLLQAKSTRDSARLFDQVLNLVSDRFVDTVNSSALYEKAARGLVNQLQDPYSELLAPKEVRTFSSRTGGRYGGVGMQIEDQQGNITVSRVFPHTPAEQAGIQEGDRIIFVDTSSTKGWSTSQVSDALLGAPGTKVTARFARPGVVEPIQVRFTRAEIHIPAVPFALMLEGGIGYIPVQTFNELATDEVEAQLARLAREGARSIVLDLRDNPGGILDQALSMSNLFLPQGKELASVRGRTESQTYVARERPVAPSIPLVVMVDGSSASASEIVAGALQDHDRALIVGTTSFGKGLVQTLFQLDGGYALKMTTAKWFTPSGRSIQKERKLVDGRLVELPADSTESDSAKKQRPVFRSDAGRIVYGGGAITPDVTVPSDTLTTAEQLLAKTLAPKVQQVYVTLYAFALEQKAQVKPNFTVTQPWRDEFYNRLQKAGVKLEREQYDAGKGYIDRLIANRVARFAFGDSTAKRREIADDTQLLRAMELLRKGQTQKDLFALVPVTRAN